MPRQEKSSFDSTQTTRSDSDGVCDLSITTISTLITRYHEVSCVSMLTSMKGFSRYHARVMRITREVMLITRCKSTHKLPFLKSILHYIIII